MTTLINIILFAVTCYGISFIISQEKIFNFLRVFIQKKNKFLGNLITCPYCLSVWTGFFMAFVWPQALIEPQLLNIFAGGMVSYTATKLISKNDIIL